MRQVDTMTSNYDMPPGRLGQALDAAMVQAVREPPAGDAIFGYPGLVEVDWDAASSCHESNVSVVGTIGARDFGIRPAGYGESCRVQDSRNLFDDMRRRANERGLGMAGRVALVAVMALYNEDGARASFRGRGWTLTARQLGDYLRDRADRRPVAFDSLLLAMATYHGW